MKQIITSLRILFVFTVLTGVIYPLIMTGCARLAFSHKANGSMIAINGKIIGSEIIGQRFESAKYFHGRISASRYDALFSGGSNYGPGNEMLAKRVSDDAARIRRENGISDNVKIPADLVTSSASGLDPHIGVDSALLQVSRIAKARNVDESTVRKIIVNNVEKRYFNMAGDVFVNVLKMNLELDAKVKSL